MKDLKRLERYVDAIASKALSLETKFSELNAHQERICREFYQLKTSVLVGEAQRREEGGFIQEELCHLLDEEKVKKLLLDKLEKAKNRKEG